MWGGHDKTLIGVFKACPLGERLPARVAVAFACVIRGRIIFMSSVFTCSEVYLVLKD